MRWTFFLLPLFLLKTLAYALDYQVKFEGIKDKKTLLACESVSQLFSLKKKPPVSLNALRYRADSDIPVLLKVLESQGYYDATVQMFLEENGSKYQVIIHIDPGPLYTLESYTVYLQKKAYPIDLKSLGIKLHEPARTETILNAELKLLTTFSESGFPLAEVEERSMIVDCQTKTVRVELFLLSGKHCLFGPSTIQGETEVKPLFIQRKIAWKEGASYDSHLVEKTQKDLIDSGLFSSVLITHDPLSEGEGKLPMRLEVTENKHKSINLGVSYQTVFGPGLTGGWEHRNLAGMGRTLSIQGDITRISTTGNISYLHPDCFREKQDYIAEGEASYEKLFAYLARGYTVNNRIDCKYSSNMRFSYGVQGEYLLLSQSIQNGNFWLIEVPLYFRFSTAKDFLNPQKGITLEASLVPSVNIERDTEFYAIQELSESTYLPLTKEGGIILAQKITLGTSYFGHLDAIPVSKRFLGGSEQEMRGYRYRTVSPLEDQKPKGGGSAIYGLLEARFKVTKTIGIVPFFDIGNVYTSSFPTSKGKWLKSTGLGIRYFSFMGPFRLDVAIPLNRRKGIDPVYKILVSIGQTF